MTADEAVVAVIEALERASIPHMVVGSLASNFHGIPRSTRDADIVVSLASGRLQEFEKGLPAGLRLDPQASFETVTATTRHMVTLDGSAFVCELFVASDDPHDRERFPRRQRVRLLGLDVWVATVEDTIVTKLRWASHPNRLKDREDIRNMVAVRGAEVDWAYVSKWTAVHETAPLLQEIRASLA